MQENMIFRHLNTQSFDYIHKFNEMIGIHNNLKCHRYLSFSKKYSKMEEYKP